MMARMIPAERIPMPTGGGCERAQMHAVEQPLQGLLHIGGEDGAEDQQAPMP